MPKECDCIKIRRLFDAAIDGELSPREKRKLEAHLAYCEFCREEYEDRKRLTQAICFDTPEAPMALHNAVMSRVKPAIRFYPKMAIVGSLCVFALILGALFSPAFLGNGMKDAANAMPEASGGLGEFTEEQDKTDRFDQANTSQTESVPSIVFDAVYSIADTDLTVRFFKDETAIITDEQNHSHNATYQPEDGLIKISIGQNEAFFAIENRQLLPRGGDLFD